MLTYEMEGMILNGSNLFYLPIVVLPSRKFTLIRCFSVVSKFVHAEDLIVPYGATDLLTAPRITHVIRMDSNEVRKMQIAGFYRDIDLPTGGTSESDYSDVRNIDGAQGVQLSGKSTR